MKRIDNKVFLISVILFTLNNSCITNNEYDDNWLSTFPKDALIGKWSISEIVQNDTTIFVENDSSVELLFTIDSLKCLRIKGNHEELSFGYSFDTAFVLVNGWIRTHYCKLNLFTNKIILPDTTLISFHDAIHTDINIRIRHYGCFARRCHTCAPIQKA